MSLLRIIFVCSFIWGMMTISSGRLMAQGFDFDMTFMRNIGAGGLKGYGYSAALQNDGGIIVCGPANAVDMLPCGGVVRYFADGRLDEQFRINALRSMPFRVWKVLTQVDGKILALYGSYPEWNNHYKVVRLNADGTMDSTFTFHFNYPANFSLFTIQENGFSSVIVYDNGIHVMRCRSDGSLDSTVQSIRLSDAAEVSIPYRGGTLLSGKFTSCNGEYTGNLIRVDSNGKLDKNFRPYLDRKGLSVRCFAACTDGKIVIAATSEEKKGFLWWEETVRFIWHIMRLNPDGSEDATFHAPELPAVRWIRAIYPQEDGKVLVNESIIEHTHSVLTYKLYRLNGDGSHDSSFKEGVLYSDFGGSISQIHFLKNGQLLLVDGWGGTDASYRGHTFHKFLRLNSDGEVDEDFCFQDSPRGLNGQIRVVTPLENGQLLVAGKFKENYGFPTSMIARLNADGTLDRSFRSVIPPSSDIGSDAQSLSGVCSMAIQPDGKILVGGDFSEEPKQGQWRSFGLVRLNTDGSLDSSFHCPLTKQGEEVSFVTNVIALPNGKSIIGCYYYDLPRLASLQPNGSIDTVICTDLFNKGRTDSSGSISNFFLQRDGKLLVSGHFTRFNGYDAHQIVRLNADYSMDEPFLRALQNSITAEEVRSIAPQSDGKILVVVGKKITNPSEQGMSRDTVLRLNIDGTRDTTFQCSFYPLGYAVFSQRMSVQHDGGILMSGFHERFGENNPQMLPLFRLHPNGTMDEDFPTMQAGEIMIHRVYELSGGKSLIQVYSSATIKGISFYSFAVLTIPPRKLLPHEILPPLPSEENDDWDKIFLRGTGFLRNTRNGITLPNLIPRSK